MFRLDHNPQYWWPVVVRWPDPAKPGEMAEHQFEGRFNWLDDEAYAKWLADAREKQLADRDAALAILVGFRHVQQPDGTPLEPTPDTLRQLLAQQGVATAVVAAYFASRDQAAQKNSPRPR
jgi:hypothetical protein